MTLSYFCSAPQKVSWDHVPRYLWLTELSDTVAVGLSYPPVPFRMDDDIVAKSALAAMEACFMNHPESVGKCEPHVVPRLPSRVIDVGTFDGAIEPKLHINNNGEYAYYACLSYCWGGDQQFSTTRATLAGNVQALRFENLSQRIQDALKVTHILKHR